MGGRNDVTTDPLFWGSEGRGISGNRHTNISKENTK